jgi:hypothetical protein
MAGKPLQNDLPGDPFAKEMGPKKLKIPDWQTWQLLPVSSDFLLFHQAGKMLKGSIEGFLGTLRKTTPRQLTVPEVILQALTADALLGTRVVRAGAFRDILFFLALQGSTLDGFLYS